MLKQGIETLFEKPTHQENGELVSQRTVFPELEFRLFFMLKGEGVKSWFKPDSRGVVLISYFLQPITGGPGQDVSCEPNKSI